MSQVGIVKNSITADIGAPELAAIFKGILPANGIVKEFSDLACARISDNLVRMSAGVYNLSGYMLAVRQDTTEDFIIDSGTAGYNRKDLLIAEFVRNGGGAGVDTLAFRILKGTAVVGAAADPALTTSDINGTGVTHQEALYRLTLTGTVLAAPTLIADRAPPILNNYTATTDPTTGDDTGDGYTVGSEWINTTTDKSFKCLDATTGSAIWINTASAIKRYGFRRAKANSDPTARIEYLFDAVGLTPAAMNFGTGVFGYGSWQTFVEDVSRPVMLKLDGTVDYELSRSDFTKKSDGITASDVSNTAYVGNAMIEFKKYKWVKRYEDATYEYVIFADGQYDDTYNAYAHTNALGTVKPAFYWGAFKGVNVSSKLKSFADQTIMVSQTRNTEAAYAAANGGGYYTIYKSGWDYICDLLTLIGKSDSAQSVFGGGRNGSASALATGTLKAQPMFKGYSDNTSDVKVFGIEGFWDNIWEGMAGLVFNGNIRTKMVPAYNFDGAGYTETGIVPSGTSGGYISSAGVNDVSGFVPKVASGSASTYYCDGLWYNNAQVDYAVVGGLWTDGLLDGPRSVDLGDLASLTYVALGSRLSYINPA